MIHSPLAKCRIVLAATCFFVLMGMTIRADADDSKPNFVFIIADDLTFRDLGVYGGQAHTPNIDHLATQGMRMTRCFQTAPMCSPTRHNIYTGQYPIKTGAYPNHTQTYDDVKNITHYLSALGYRVALSGKTHIGPRNLFQFEYTGKNNNPDMEAISQLFSECQSSDTPFCLFACSNEPHTPWNKGDASQYPPSEIVLPPYIGDTPTVREHFSRYLAEITYFDQQVGDILNLLEKNNLVDNTVVMVVSEQGNSLPFAKWTCYDNGLQSGMIVRWPGHIAPGSTTDAMVEYCDVTPTFVDIAGGKLAPELDGKSMLPVLLGKADHHKDYVFGEMTTHGIINGTDCYPIRSVRSEKFKLIRNLNFEEEFTNACTSTQPYLSMVEAAENGNETIAALVERYQHRPEIEFYDVVNDPLELNNLADDPQYKDEIAELGWVLDKWMKQQGDEGIETELSANSHVQKKKKQQKNSKRKSK
ncbi:sulfatase [Thalassoglobus sp. JC818]|uniref:sulfatase family protein n=1 Tax=Thalassoglobus sp. JC818 TaxID=3232136 RepID=UPI003459DA09